MKKFKIAPSILAADPANLGNELKKIEEAGADYVHIDVMDGHFVPNFAFSPDIVKGLRGICNLTFDVHLMISEPKKYIEAFVKAGADILTIHLESDTRDNTLACLQKIRSLGCRAGLSLKPGTPAEEARQFLPYCDMILVMTVEPGFGGQKFMADQMPKLRSLREMLRAENPGCLLQVDGGVDAHTCGICKENGAQVLVAGSAYFRAQDRAALVRLIQAESYE